MAADYILETNLGCNILSYTYLLADAVYECETALGEQDGQGYAGQSAACADIGQTGSGGKLYYLGYGHGMEYVMLVKIVNILAGNDVYLAVPVGV